MTGTGEPPLLRHLKWRIKRQLLWVFPGAMPCPLLIWFSKKIFYMVSSYATVVTIIVDEVRHFREMGYVVIGLASSLSLNIYQSLLWAFFELFETKCDNQFVH